MSEAQVELAETIFTPVMTTDAAIQAWKKFQSDKTKILDKSDIALIPVKSRQPDGSYKTELRPFTKKSGWNKLSCFYGASTETTKYQKINNDDGSFVYIVSVRAYTKLPDGREYSVERSAAVSSLEKEKTEGMKKSPRKEHDVIASAETRAEGRALAAYFGTGEVSAEEIEGGVLENVHAHDVPQTPEDKEKDRKIKEGFCIHPDDEVRLVEHKTSDGIQYGCGKCQRRVDEATALRIKEKRESK